MMSEVSGIPNHGRFRDGSQAHFIAPIDFLGFHVILFLTVEPGVVDYHWPGLTFQV